MRAFPDLYEAYVYWKDEGGYLTWEQPGEYLVLERGPPDGSEDCNDLGIYPDFFGETLERDEFFRIYERLPPIIARDTSAPRSSPWCSPTTPASCALPSVPSPWAAAAA